MSFVLGSPPQAKKIIVLSTKNIHLPILEWEYTNFVRSLFWEGRDNVGRDGDRISNVGRDVPPVTPLKGGTGKLCPRQELNIRKYPRQDQYTRDRIKKPLKISRDKNTRDRDRISKNTRDVSPVSGKIPETRILWNMCSAIRLFYMRTKNILCL